MSEERWRARAKKLIAIAREAQFELTAKTIHYMALRSVMTDEEHAVFQGRIRADMANRKARRAALKAPTKPLIPSSQKGSGR